MVSQFFQLDRLVVEGQKTVSLSLAACEAEGSFLILYRASKQGAQEILYGKHRSKGSQVRIGGVIHCTAFDEMGNGLFSVFKCQRYLAHSVIPLRKMLILAQLEESPLAQYFQHLSCR